MTNNDVSVCSTDCIVSPAAVGVCDMTQDDWVTLRIPSEAYEEAKKQKEKHSRTWSEQIVRPGDSDTDTVGDGIDVDAITEQFRRAFPYDDHTNSETRHR